VLEERQRLAREIHDTLAQGFTSIVIHLETAMSEIEQHPQRPGQERVERAVDTARRSLEEARRVVRDLRPDLLEVASLVQAIKRTASHWQDEHGVATTVEVNGVPLELGGDREVTLYRAAEEALANVLKHARASSVAITLSYEEGEVVLTVRDNGDGMEELDHLPSGSYGIRGMRERAEGLGGTVLVTGDPGRGTTVTLSLPIEEQRS
jgi:signal transduction histidine kinase